MLNWIPEVGGPATRRYGTNKQLELDYKYEFSETNGDVKKFNFQYGENSYDTVYVHTDTRVPLIDGGSDLSACVMSIFNADGRLIKEFPKEETPWLQRDIATLFILQSFDALYIYSANAPTMRLVREAEDVWTLDAHTYNGGPWKLGNADRTSLVSMEIPVYNPATVYPTGALVLTGTTLSLSGVVSNVYYTSRFEALGPYLGVEIRQYYSRITTTTPPTGIYPGYKILVTGATPTEFNTEWVVGDVDVANNTIDLFTGTELTPVGSTWTNDFSGTDLSAAGILVAGARQLFHVSKLDGNVGNDPTAQPSDYWTEDNQVNTLVTLKATANLWSEEDEGRSFRISGGEIPRLYGTFESTDEGEVSETIPVMGQITLTTEGGIWDGELALQQSLDQGGSWQDIGAITSTDGNRNGVISRTVSDWGSWVRVFMRARNPATGDTGCKYNLTVDDPQFAYFTLETYISPTEMQAIPQNSTASLPSGWRWNESAFGPNEGYPGAAAILDNTMIISGIVGSPGTLWFSNIGDWTNWVSGGYAGAAFDVQVGKDTRNIVQWIQAKESLLIGTDAGEWSIEPRNTDLTLSLTNYRLERQAEYGSSPVPALAAGSAVIYVEVDSFRVRALERGLYDRGTYQPSDISFQVPDWFETSSVKELAYSRSPIPVVWVLMEDQRLYSWTFDPVNQVSAWAEHVIYGVDQIYSISVTPTGVGDVLLITARSGSRLIELAATLENLKLDNHEVYEGVLIDMLYYFSGEGDTPLAYDGAYIQKQDALYTNSVGGDNPEPKILHLTASAAALRVLLDGEVLGEGVDYILLGGSNDLFAYIPYSSGTLTFFDGLVALVDGVDYNLYDGADCTYLTVFDPTTWADYTIENGGGALPTTDFLVMSNDLFALVPNEAPDDLTIKSNPGAVVQTRGLNYLAVPLTQCIAFPTLPRESQATVGYRIENLLWPLDLLSDLKLGGPGGTVRYKEVDLLVKNSLGLQIRGYTGWLNEEDEEEWTTVADLIPTSILGEALIPYTGVQRVDFSSDTQYNGVDIQIRANTPRDSTIGSMAVDVERVK